MNFESKKIEDCFNGGSIFEYKIEKDISKDLIFELGCLGDLEYFGDFPRPFFRIISGDGIHAKGVEGEKAFRVIYSKRGLNEGKVRVEKTISGLNPVEGRR